MAGVAAMEILEKLPSPETFYEKYVSKRRPVVLKSCGKEFAPKLFSMTLSELERLSTESKNNKEEEAMVEVNRTAIITTLGDRSKGCASFSPADNSTIQTMKFTKFLQVLQQTPNNKAKDASDAVTAKEGDADNDKDGDDTNIGPYHTYYMTTQTLPLDEITDRPALYTHPIHELVDSNTMELRPKLLGNSIPMTYNLWIGKTNIHGASHNTATSGLHHDFHDNLYCLLKGNKTFYIAPPELVQTIKMHGTLVKLHDNGRIVYKEQLQEENGGNNKSDMIRPDGAFESVERIMELELEIEAINAEIASEKDDDKIAKWEEKLNSLEEELLDLETMGNSNGDEEENGEQEEEEEKADEDAAALKASSSDGNDNNDDTSPKVKRRKVDKSTTPTKRKVPVNFCVTPPLTPQQQQLFTRVNLHANDLLFLPAGWFHEVESFGGLHMALNYWMHPVDVGGTACFERPYHSKFWQRDWESRGLSS